GTMSWTEFNIPNVYPAVCTNKRAVFSSNNGPTLFWRTDEKNLLLSFDFRRDDDPFQLIRVPVECESQLAYKSTVYRYEFEYPLVHLLEFTGCLCLAHLESLTPMDNNPPQEHENNNTWKMVNLYILQDKVEGVWNNQLRFDLTPYSLPCTITPRFSSISDQILLYWLDHNGFQFINLRKKHLKVITTLTPPDILQNNQCREDLGLGYHVENLYSLRSLLPNGAQQSD
ncbi:hypothetical protein MKW98_013964, partial [Papaver atlanticum]